MGLLAFKALHLIAMVAWFCGLFYMFRLFVYHVENRDSKDNTDMLKTMERKLYKIITLPAMVVTLVAGFGMLGLNPAYASQRWFQIKFCLVLCLVGYTFFVGKTLKRFKNDDIFLTSKNCRVLNEVPTLFLVSIIILAVYRHI